MKTVARITLQPGMVIAQDLFSYQGELLCQKGTKIDKTVISRLTRHSITAVPIMEEIDYAQTHFEKVRLSEGFKKFEQEYEKSLAKYKVQMNEFVEYGLFTGVEELLNIYGYLSGLAHSGVVLLGYLFNMVPSEDALTHTHCLNSALIAGVYADWLGMSPENKEILILCAFFYDIGKLKLPYDLLWKTGKLSDIEFAAIKTHPIMGYEIIKDIKLDPHIYKAVLMHHERCDGMGYPSRLKDSQIDPFAKHIAIIDAYEAMTSPRAYRNSLTPLQVTAKFEEEYNRYDQTLLRPFLKRIADTQIGLTVKLTDESLWEIFIINPLQLSRPILRRGEREILNLSDRKDLDIVSIH